MRITPLDVRKQEFRKAVRGLDADEVHAFLATVADEYEVVLTDNKKLRDKVIELDEKVGEYRNMEKTLRDTLLTAERVMAEARQNARKEADLVLRDAQIKASQEVAGISGRVEVLHHQIRELRGHRDSYLLRLQSLSEAQLGLIEGYRQDFESTDKRIDRVADAVAEETAPEAAAAPDLGEPMVPAWDPPTAAGSQIADDPQSRDEWRRYDVGEKAALELDPIAIPPEPIPTPETRTRPASNAPTHLHTPAPDAAGSYEAMAVSVPDYPAAPDYPPEEESRYTQHLSAEEYEARVASVADAWSGAVPRVGAANLPQGHAAAIDEVSAALGMFTEGGVPLPQPASIDGESTRVAPVAPASGYSAADADRANELAPVAHRTEPVDYADGPLYPEADSIEAPAEARPEDQTDSQEGRWSLSRIARGITGH